MCFHSAGSDLDCLDVCLIKERGADYDDPMKCSEEDEL